MLTVFWTNEALAQVAAIGDYLAITSPEYAERAIDELIDRVGQLAQFPKSGHVYWKAQLPQVRELLVRPYRIIYYVGQNQIDVMAVLHQNQNI